MTERVVRGKLLSLYAVGILVLLLISSGLRAADSLPSQIPDDAYWKLIEAFSEPTGTFTSENFTSNENGFQKILGDLQAVAKPGGVYLGVGPEQNFTYIAALRPKIAFIVDIRRQNLIQHMFYKAAFEMADNRADFLSIIFARKRPDGLSEKSTIDELMRAYSGLPSDEATFVKNLQAVNDLLLKKHQFGLTKDDQTSLDHVYRVFSFYGPSLNYSSTDPPNSRGGSGGNGVNFSTVMTATDNQNVQRGFLASEDNYRILRELEGKNLLIPIVGDFGGPKALRAVGQYLKDHGATVTAYYTSNVEQYLFSSNTGRARVVNGGATNFYENVGTLPLDAASVFIRSGVPTTQNQGRGGNAMNNSQIAPIQATVDAYKTDKIQEYSDIFYVTK